MLVTRHEYETMFMFKLKEYRQKFNMTQRDVAEKRTSLRLAIGDGKTIAVSQIPNKLSYFVRYSIAL